MLIAVSKLNYPFLINDKFSWQLPWAIYQTTICAVTRFLQFCPSFIIDVKVLIRRIIDNLRRFTFQQVIGFIDTKGWVT